MATSSITHNFIITDPKVAERLDKALEESANDPTRPCTVDAEILNDPDELKEFMERRRVMIAARDSAEKKE